MIDVYNLSDINNLTNSEFDQRNISLEYILIHKVKPKHNAINKICSITFTIENSNIITCEIQAEQHKQYIFGVNYFVSLTASVILCHQCQI